MNIIQEQQLHCNQQKALDDFRKLVFVHAPALGRLLDELDAGSIPKPLDVMSALSEGVAFFTECDTNQEVAAQVGEMIHHVRCRLC